MGWLVSHPKLFFWGNVSGYFFFLLFFYLPQVWANSKKFIPLIKSSSTNFSNQPIKFIPNQPIKSTQQQTEPNQSSKKQPRKIFMMIFGVTNLASWWVGGKSGVAHDHTKPSRPPQPPLGVARGHHKAFASHPHGGAPPQREERWPQSTPDKSRVAHGHPSHHWGWREAIP